MRVLIITKLFPNAVEPLSSPFNRQQFAALSKLCEVEILATIPWFPGARLARQYSAAGRLVEVPREDIICGLPVHHPRYLFLPRYGNSIAGALYAASLLPHVLRYRHQLDVILAAWAYPDGAAAITLARMLGVPAVVKVHGTDINVVAKMWGPRWNLRRILPHAARVVAVSRPLADEVVRLGVAPERTLVVMNGIDSSLFRVRDREQTRAELGLPSAGKMLLYVGRLEAKKGALDLLEAFALLAPRRRDLTLVMLGDGAARNECETLAARIGPQVKLNGPKTHDQVARWLGACDLLTLPSWNEGTPNVLIEALASGRPVVATRVGGIPDLIDDPLLGELVPPRDPAALALALERVADRQNDAAIIAARGARGAWEESAAQLLRVLEAVVHEHAPDSDGRRMS